MFHRTVAALVISKLHHYTNTTNILIVIMIVVILIVNILFAPGLLGLPAAGWGLGWRGLREGLGFKV